MDEYISIEEAVETIRYRVCQGHGNKEHICKRGSCAYCGIMEIMDDISSIKAADVQPVKHGRWLSHKITASSKCSECNSVYADETPYCPSCGARMDLRDGDING